MANTFTVATLNLGNAQLPLPGSSTLFSGAVTAPAPVTPGTTELPITPLPGNPTYSAVPL